jgi:Family of unknown function (DUF6182)
MPDGPTTPGGSGVADGWLTGRIDERHERAARGLTARRAAVPDVTVPVAMRAFDPGSTVAGALEFAAGLSEVDADSWFRCYTRTLFLVGNPVNIAERFPPATVAGNGTIAWLGVHDRRHTDHVRRLLRPVSGELPGHAASLDTVVASAAEHPVRHLWIAVRGLDVARYLVHLHHTVAEAVLLGLLPPRTALALHHVDDLDPVRAGRSNPAFVRVHHGPDERLRLFTLLTADDRNDPPTG